MPTDEPTHHAIDPDSLAALPRSAGVYIFRGEGTLPLYIGKSVDIRSRVLSHLRTPDEANMLAQTKRIDFIETIQLCKVVGLDPIQLVDIFT
mgnify:CR=1 FL=1